MHDLNVPEIGFVRVMTYAIKADASNLIKEKLTSTLYQIFFQDKPIDLS